MQNDALPSGPVEYEIPVGHQWRCKAENGMCKNRSGSYGLEGGWPMDSN